MKDLIVFAEDWGGLPSSTQHLVKRLARDRKVLWINSIGLRQPGFNRRDVSRVWQKLRPQRSGSDERLDYSETHCENIMQANLLTIPAPRSPLARLAARKMMLHQLRPLIAKYELKQPILWCSLPTAADLCDQLDHGGVVYYCGDDFSSLAGVDHDTVSRHEQTLVKYADLILVPSLRLNEKFPTHKTQLLPHGVDTDLFTRPAKRAADFPQTDGPIAGFYGSLSSWLDFDLIEYCADALPHWKFMFIGPRCVERSHLPQRDNIHYLGARAHHQLPSYSQYWDVGMLPFKNNAQIDACNPLKLLEYLAAARPVVSVPFPALTPYLSHVHRSTDKADFVNALQQARHAPAIPASAVIDDSWNHRSDALNLMLEQL